jgi:addiction module HigA family antidote
MSQKEFAFIIGSSEEAVSKIINGECAITPDIAVQFERVLKIPADFWLRRQHIYDEMFSKDESVNAT